MTTQSSTSIAFLADFNQVQRELVRSWADGRDERMRAYLQKVLEFIAQDVSNPNTYVSFSKSSLNTLFRQVCDAIGLSQTVYVITAGRQDATALTAKVCRDSLLALQELLSLATFLVSKGADIPTDISNLVRSVREEISDQHVLRAVRELENAYSVRELQGKKPREISRGGADVCVAAKPRPQAAK